MLYINNNENIRYRLMHTTTTYSHNTVLLHEAVDALQIIPDGIYVDGTLGGGGHSKEILKRLGKNGKLICFDHDKDAWSNAPNDKRVILVKENFRYIKRFLRYHNIEKVNGILADLGVSSHHFDTAERGFSIRFDAALDMRMDNRTETTAAEILMQYSEKQLHLLFEKYGEVRNAKTLAKTIVSGRETGKIETIENFKNLIKNCIKGNPNKYLAQVFQALRIEVNQELEVLQSFLEQTTTLLASNGILAVITFHSLEDKIVKQFMRNSSFDKSKDDIYGHAKVKNEWKVLKDIVPTEEEIKTNPRSRSARLRRAIKL